MYKWDLDDFEQRKQCTKAAEFLSDGTIRFKRRLEGEEDEPPFDLDYRGPCYYHEHVAKGTKCWTIISQEP